MVWLVGLTLFASAFCLFWGQLLVGKLLLPLWGGSPLVWDTCLAFFQLVLLLGYLWADWLGRGRHPELGVPIHGILMLAGLKFLPFEFRSHPQPEEAFPPLALLANLAVGAGVPLLLLSGTSPLLQRGLGKSKRDPYGLYGASNAGSLAGLLGYPLLLEPRLSLAEQTHLWRGAYALVAGLVLLGGVGLLLKRQGTDPSVLGEPVAIGRAEPSFPGEGWRWAGWAFLPAGLVVAVTTLLTTDVAAVPLLWAIPLSIYLVTFMLAFGGIHPNELALGTTALLACGAIGAQVMGWVKPWSAVLPLHLGAFGLVSWACHSQLVRCRPPAQQLTRFYLWLALGGSLGGLFAALLAPQVFEAVLEYPLLLSLALAALAPQGGRLGLGLGLGLLLPLLLVHFRFQALFHLGAAVGLGLGWVVLALGGEGGRGWLCRLGVTMGLVLLLGQLWLPPGLQVVASERSVFGLHRLVEYRNEAGSFRSLLHGTTLHGSQNLDPQKALEPLTYFSRPGPVGQALRRWRAQLGSSPAQVAVLGLGIGTLAAYAEPGDEWTFFELDPTVANWAGRYFAYLDWASQRARVRVILGDARLRLQGIPDGSYDLLVMDAFSSDAVPLHLLTQEALTLYLSKLKPQGWLLFNITHRHLNLAPVLAALARELQLSAWHQAQEDLTAAQRQAGLAPSHWVLMARGSLALQSSDGDPWQPLLPQAGDPLWRDDFSNLLQVLRWS